MIIIVGGVQVDAGLPRRSDFHYPISVKTWVSPLTPAGECGTVRGLKDRGETSPIYPRI